jgi:hypothetical protein
MFYLWEKKTASLAAIYFEEELEDRKNDNYLRPDDEDAELGIDTVPDHGKFSTIWWCYLSIVEGIQNPYGWWLILYQNRPSDWHFQVK